MSFSSRKNYTATANDIGLSRDQGRRRRMQTRYEDTKRVFKPRLLKQKGRPFDWISDKQSNTQLVMCMQDVQGVHLHPVHPLPTPLANASVNNYLAWM